MILKVGKNQKNPTEDSMEEVTITGKDMNEEP